VSSPSTRRSLAAVAAVVAAVVVPNHGGRLVDRSVIALDGEAGVRAVLSNLVADLDLSVALTGHDAVADVTRDALADA